jgi:hypothetical protein
MQDDTHEEYRIGEATMSSAMTHGGKCFCGSVEFSVTGEPAAMGYCHCSSCRQWSAAPVNAFTLWPRDAVRITKGADNIASYHRTEKSLRKWCKTCGGHLFAEVPIWNMADVFAAVMPSLPFKSTIHVHYQEAVLSMKDGLPKWKGLPKEYGGSGELLSD